jgi:hypothetical protein
MESDRILRNKLMRKVPGTQYPPIDALPFEATFLSLTYHDNSVKNWFSENFIQLYLNDYAVSSVSLINEQSMR